MGPAEKLPSKKAKREPFIPEFLPKAFSMVSLGTQAEISEVKSKITGMISSISRT